MIKYDQVVNIIIIKLRVIYVANIIFSLILYRQQ